MVDRSVEAIGVEVGHPGGAVLLASDVLDCLNRLRIHDVTGIESHPK
jgi:hypothetical protein